jgi:hypothetical protein
LAIYMTLTEISMVAQRRNKMPRKIRSDKKVNEVKYKGSIRPQPELNKKRFEALLTKAAQPLKPDSITCCYGIITIYLIRKMISTRIWLRVYQ